MDLYVPSFLIVVPVIVFIIGMHIHNQILTKYTRYNSTGFKYEYERTYSHLFKDKIPYEQNDQNSDRGELKHLPKIGINVAIQPNWVKQLNDPNDIFVAVFILSAPANAVKRIEMRKDFDRFISNYYKQHKSSNISGSITLPFLLGQYGKLQRP